jgi:hypothetical protein
VKFVRSDYGRELGLLRLVVGDAEKRAINIRDATSDYRTHDIRHVIVVSHGVTVRAFTMGWMRYSPEWLDTERNPGNCWIPHIHRLSTATCGS